MKFHFIPSKEIINFVFIMRRDENVKSVYIS